ncbi:probable ATP-dependent DNA helicase HFM1 isoform X2 [Poecilia reticulata]|uniref:probable ATP-dependent DNA helicase HFM1 isoform X2 n=1 Tax=Poecilia reticulata TaxID=8081 RepID=UPI0004A22B6F|nr:PREDICTED: probable ATP-dependent DNA helicase HFM1 isoform X2 [Poecilia reticulata]
MFDADDCTLSLDSLFFEKPTVHKVKPFPLEGSQWQLDEPPPLKHIPATQDMQQEAESLSALYSFTQKPKKFQPPFKGLNASSSKINRFYSFNDEERRFEETQGDCTSNLRGNNGCSGDEGLKDYPDGSFLSGGGGDEIQLDSCHAAISRCLPGLPLRRSLFRSPALSGAGDLSTNVDLKSCSRNGGGGEKISRPQTFLNPVAMATVPPALQLPQAAIGKAAPPFSCSSAVSVRPLQQAPHAETPYKGAKKAFVPPMTPQPLHIQGSSGSEVLRPVSEIPLCSQCYDSWSKKFGPLGLTCKELTGDTEIDDLFEIHDSHIILTTPEKWDSMSRKWKDSLLQLVRLFLIDEVHVVKDATRGATLEVVVSRMKAVNSYRTSQNPEAGVTMRLVAVSATIPNICDIADWLSNGSEPASYLSMDESHRPVKLRKVVLGFPCSGTQTEFKFDLSLNYKMANIIQTYSDQKPTLVFCSTRKGAQQSAAVLAKDTRFIMSFEHKQRLMTYANSTLDSKLRDLMMLGVGYHHAGVDLSDRKLVEEAFTLGDLPVLFTTRTLAMGVNLPAHLVVIKSTMQYVAGSCEEYSEADILQMIGRAGRPQFDTSATAVIMTKVHTREKYMKLMNGIEIIESSLHSHLVEHLNAEIVLQTISDVNMALDWIRSTFLYIRALKNPSHYGFSTNLDRYGIEAKLQELCLKTLNSLSAIDLITMDEDINIKPTEAGRLMARYCVAFETMQLFSRVTGSETLPDLVDLMSKSKEFRDVQLRVNEKKTLNTLNRDKNRATIRFPLEGKIKNSEMKVNCLIQAQLNSISIQDFGLIQETAKIFRIGMRISKCLSEFLTQQSKTGFCAALNSLILAKCFRAKLWENSPFVSKQMEKIGLTLSTAMVNAGLTSFSKIEQTNPRELELILNRHPPFGNQIRESVVHLPKYDINLEQLPRYSSATAEVVVKVTLQNQAQLLSRRTAPDHHYVSLIIGNSENHVVILHKLKDSLLLKSGSWTKKIDVPKASKGNEISVNLISSEYVGLDIQLKFPVYYSAAAQNLGTKIPQCKTDNLVGQRAQHSNCSETQKASSAKKLDSASKRQCNHFCKNKNLCAHDCCKVGVAVGQKRSANHESSFSSYLEDLRNRSDVLAQTPVKRLKIKMSEEPLSVNMKRFAYNPRETLHSFSWHAGNEYKSADMELTAEHYAELPDVVSLEDFDRDYRFSAEDGSEGLAETSQTSPAAPAYHQNSSKWMTLKFSSGSRPPPNQISTVSSALSGWSTAVPEQKKPYKSPSSLQIPSVTFDLGNEWDDWRDFDDENLLNASETSPPPCESSFQPQVQQHVQNKISAPVLISSSQAEPCMTTFTTSLRSISHSSPEIRNVGLSSISQSFTSQKRIALDWDKQRPNVFSDVFNVKTPEKLPAHTLGEQVSRRLDFFSTMNATSSSNLPLHKSTEEEAFLGIFDGIF